MGKNSCCYECNERYLGCHSECARYLEESSKRQARNELIVDKKNKHADVDYYCIGKEVKRITKRKKW